MGAIVWIAEHPRAIVDLVWAKDLATALGVPFDKLLELDPKMMHTPTSGAGRDEKRRHGWLIFQQDKLKRDVVQISDFAAAACTYMGMYANIDHSHQSPHGTAGKQANYVALRACLRMARYFWPDTGERDLLQEVPAVGAAGVGTVLRDERTGAKLFDRDGKPLVVGRDALLRERIYKI